MAWCPMCKSEYVEGITECVDCGCALVEVLPKESHEDEITQEMAASMVQEVQELMEDNGENEDEPDAFAFDEEEITPKYQPVYVNNEEKAEENRSSAFTLLFVGGVGLVFIVLLFFDVISFRLTLISKYMISGVMGVLFILFIVMGIVSMRNSKILKMKACKENNLTQEIKKWCGENFSKEKIDDALNMEQQSEELQYFQRVDHMKQLIQKQFMNLDEAYLDRLIEEMYSEIFE